MNISNANITGLDRVGALVGESSNSSVVNNCSSSGTVNGTGVSNNVGGLIGMNNSSNLNNSYSTCSVTGYDVVGGLVGENIYSSTVNNSYSTGSVSGRETIGGLVGVNASSTSVSNSYSRGSVNGDEKVGGLIGYNFSSCTVINSYSTGNVVGTSFVGGLAGLNNGTISNSFWDTETSGQASSAGGIGKTTAQMKIHTTFTAAGWDFEIETANGTNDYWDMDYSGTINSGYPFLSWQNGGAVSLPVELTSFSARCEGLSVILEWITESEVDNLGYILERKLDYDWLIIASYQDNPELQGQGNVSTRHEYRFTDEDVESGLTYIYRLSDVDIKGNVSFRDALTITVFTEPLPEITDLLPAFPNPFNPQAYIAYNLAESADVSISVFDILGRHIKTLFNGKQFAGSYHIYWNGLNEYGSKVASGNYIIRMQTENTIQTQKVMFMK